MGAYESWIQQRKEQGLPTDFAELKNLAGKGNAGAQTALGIMYAYGWNVDQDYAMAVLQWHKAAQQGNVFAQFNLAAMYERGFGVTQNRQQAISLYRRAAEAGCKQAQERLVVLEPVFISAPAAATSFSAVLER